MATYLEIKNDEQVTQIGDTYDVQCVVRKGQINANFNNKEVYGFFLNKNETAVLFNVDFGSLVISPPFLFIDSIIYYVASDGQPINYVTLGLPSDLAPKTHGAGLEVYNEKGGMIFSSFYEQVSYKEAVSISPVSSVFDNSGTRDSKIETAIGRLKGNAESCDCYPKYTYSGTNRAYIYAQNIPFIGTGGGDTRWGGDWNPGLGRMVIGCRFVFDSPSSFSNTPETRRLWPHVLRGGGSLDQLARYTGSKEDSDTTYFYYTGPIFITFYFHVFEAVS